MMQARKIRYDVIKLTETRRHRPLNATFDTGEELFLGTCDSRGLGGVGVLVDTNLVMNIDSFEQLTTRIGRERLKSFTSVSMAYNGTGREAEFTMTTKTIHDNTQFQKPTSLRWTWESPVLLFTQRRESSEIQEVEFQARHQLESLHFASRLLGRCIVDNIDEEYDRLVQHLATAQRKPKVQEPPRGAYPTRPSS
ncbi:hypothetical protein ANCCAN_03934 [Ancylostoma caninum]|uniref:Uncharacterized protein n=1 Tax=Ancylostoma caninum TaxID=29170 RepID=A0A368H2Q7_ANCCA|nr:hypothetical protein ANCCAN_03934 [Ancylostoma caninum]